MKLFLLLSFMTSCLLADQDLSLRFEERPLQRAKEIREELKTGLLLDRQFYLHKELFTCLFQAYQESGGNVEELSLVIKTLRMLNAQDRGDLIKHIDSAYQDILRTYLTLSDLALSLSLAAIANVQNLPYKFMQKELASEPYRPYFLQIIELEKFHNLDLDARYWISTQIISLGQMLLIVTNEASTESPYFDYQRRRERLSIYWDILVPCLFECVSLIDKRGEFEKFDKTDDEFGSLLFILPFDESIAKFYPPRDDQDDPIALFMPILIKYHDIGLMKVRFDQKKIGEEWDRAFEWILLHIEAAYLLKDEHPVKCREFLRAARKLTEETLSCYFFNTNRSAWKSKEIEALLSIQEAEEAIGVTR